MSYGDTPSHHTSCVTLHWKGTTRNLQNWLHQNQFSMKQSFAGFKVNFARMHIQLHTGLSNWHRLLGRMMDGTSIHCIWLYCIWKTLTVCNVCIKTNLRVFCTNKAATSPIVVGRLAAQTPSLFSVFSSVPVATMSGGAHCKHRRDII